MRRWGRAEHLRTGRLVEPRGHPRLPDRLQDTGRGQAGDIPGELRFVETDPHVRLRTEVIDLLRADPLHKRDQPRSVGEVPVVQEQARLRIVGVLIQVVDPRGVERRGPPDQPVHDVALVQQQLRQVRPILPRDAGDQCHPALGRVGRSITHEH